MSHAVTLRAADATDTFLYWRWSDDPAQVSSAKIEASQLAGLQRAFLAALPVRINGETQEDALIRALLQGPFANPTLESQLMEALSTGILPKALREQLLARRGAPITVHVTPSPRLAQIPWELLSVDPHLRLLDIAYVVYDPPATVSSVLQAAPARRPATSGPLFVIDPRLPAHADGGGPGQTLQADGAAAFRHYLARYGDHRPPLPISATDAVGTDIDRLRLGAILRDHRPSRMLYFGHVSSRPDQPGTASLHLSDTARIWGLMEPIHGSGIDDPNAHRPFASIDLLSGTRECRTDEQLQAFGFTERQAGHTIWPMPPRVAMIACEGGADYRANETFGLVMAMIGAGAELVTTTRWTMPTDYTIQYLHSRQAGGALPTSDLARAVDAAHQSDHPIQRFVNWQRQQLDTWRGTGNITASPLIWAAVSHTLAPSQHSQ